MPTYSEITVTFNSDLSLEDRLYITVANRNEVDDLGTWSWVATRSASNEVTLGTPTANPGETTAINFKTAFDLDYPTGYVTTVQNNNEVLIQTEDALEDFLGVTIILKSGSEPDVDDAPNNYLTEATQHKVKYYISYCDDFNTTRNVFILKKGHTGGATELLADINPISINYESSDDFKFSPIRPSQAEVFMIFGGADGVDFEEFWTADEREYKVEDVKAGTIEWSGYVIPSGFQYEFKGGLYYASIQASDGLGTLEALTFVDDNQKPYGNQDLVYNNEFEFPFSLIITEILKKLELDLDLWTCVDSYETSMTKVGDVREADPLSAAFVNVKTYIKLIEDKKVPYWYGSGEKWNCKEVLENILHIFGAKLYQESGVWRVKSINADVDYGTGATQRYWRKYNTVGTYLEGYEVVDDEVNIPCNDSTKYLVGNDHIMSMDDVYKSFRMNYEYTFVRDGDNPIDLISNGSFCAFDNDSKLAAPDDWLRWRRSNKWHIRLQEITIPFADAGGNVCGIEIGTQKTGLGTSGTDPNPAIWTSLANNVTRPGTRIRTNNRNANGGVLKGDKIIISLWNKFKYQGAGVNDVYAPMYRFILFGEESNYYLRNSEDGLIWEKIDTLNEGLEEANFFTFKRRYIESGDHTSNYEWVQYKADLGETPEKGVLMFHIHGLASLGGKNSESYPAFKTWELSGRRGATDSYDLTTRWGVIVNDWIDEGGTVPRLQVAGLQIGYIPEDSELPKQQDYIYKNTNTNYSLQVDPIAIYNGDVQDETHLSNIIVPTNVSGNKNFWDDLGDTYGTSSLGLLTVREIMRQYAKPYRILEGTIKLQDARFGSVYTFETSPNVRYILQRGSFNKQKQYVENATFVQITDDVLPSGGTEGGNTLDADWVYTGNSYCEVSSGTNTGYVWSEERDENPNSETYQDTREVLSTSQDLTACPLGDPRPYYYGSDDVFLDTAGLSFSPINQVSDNEVQIDMDNDEGNYLYFVHLKSIGVVEKIYTPTSPNNVLSDWVYVADETIDGYIYRVLRTDYVMTEFTGFTHNFKFN